MDKFKQFYVDIDIVYISLEVNISLNTEQGSFHTFGFNLYSELHILTLVRLRTAIKSHATC